MNSATEVSVRLVQRFVLVILPVIFASCIFPTDSCACVLVPPSAIAYGTVVTSNGVAIPGARVVQEMGTGSSCEGLASGVLDVATTDVAGAYEGQLGILAESRTCVRLRASASGFVSATAIGMVEGRATADPAGLDRVRLDFVLLAGR